MPPSEKRGLLVASPVAMAATWLPPVMPARAADLKNRVILSHAKTNPLEIKGLRPGPSLGDCIGDPAQIFSSQILITTL
jgi:hypothetical protein